ncbi:MAG: helix-turn-helix transcriptional regulator [Acidilobaceae archaeon]
METKALSRLKRKLTTENLWMYIVKVLADEGDMRAYDVIKRVRERFSIGVATVTAYVVLYKMSREGLIERYSSASGETLYRATEKGKTALKEAISFFKKLSEELDPEK